MSKSFIIWDEEQSQPQASQTEGKSFIVWDKDIQKQFENELESMQAMQRLNSSATVPKDEGYRKNLKINVSYPFSDKYEFKTRLEKINLDEERRNDILTGRGFIVSDYQPIKKEIKAENGIFSTRYGQSLSDTNPFIDRYKCTCGNLRSRLYNGIKCPMCKTEVKYVDDNYGCFGWLILNKYYVIHPNIYKSIEFLIGSQRLINILDKQEKIGLDGEVKSEEEIKKEEERKKRKKEPYRKERKTHEPYYGKGMFYFMEHFDEICAYYLSIASNKMSKQAYYDDIMANREKVFCQSIPVFTTHLRPYDISENNRFVYEPTNQIYTMMSSLVKDINNSDRLKIRKRHKRSIDNTVFDLQMQFNKLYTEIDKILSGKKGNVRLLAGGRFNFSSRDVIIQNPELHIDQVTLPYWCLVDILQQQIINILTMTYNISYQDAYMRWYKANITPDDTIIEIINGLIKTSCNGRGIGVIINRNPSIARGSLLQMHCVGMTFDYTMALPLTILPLLAADFDK